MSATSYPRIQFRAGELLPALAARTDPSPDGTYAEAALSQTAQRDLARYYAVLRWVLPTFSEAEASFLVDALNGLITEPHSAGLVWANLDDAAREGLAEKWGIDGPALVERVRALGPVGQLAVADAADRWWHGPSQDADRTASLRAVGLIR